MEEPARGQTILHEVMHAVDDVYGLGLGESRVRVLEQSLWALMGDLARLVGGPAAVR